MEMNSFPRWLISITPMPVPCQSSISSPARDRTSAGSIAGPALKLKIRDISRSVDGGGRLARGWRLVGRRLAVIGVPAVASIAVAVAQVALLDALQAGELLALIEGDQRDALRRAALLPDLRHRRADQHAAGGDQHDFVVVVDQHRADQGAVALRGLDRDHALAAAPMARIVGDRRALAEAVLGRGEHRFGFVIGG